MSIKIFLSSKRRHISKWQNLKLPKDLVLVSSWIKKEELDSNKFSRLAMDCIFEASICDVLWLYSEPGEVHEGAFLEAGAALAYHRPVIQIGQTSICAVFQHHPNWRQVETIEEALLQTQMLFPHYLF